MEIAALIFGILGCVFGLMALVASFVVGTIVIGWKNSTHRVEYRKPEETTYEMDAPPHIAAQLPSSPEPETLEQYMRRQARDGSSLDSIYDQSLGD